MASTISAGTTSSTALVCTADTTGALQLATNNGTVAVTVDTSQNVGIGTTSPGAKLDVTGSIRASVNVTSASDFIGGGASGAAALYANASGGLVVCRGSSSTNDVEFYTGSTERMRIDSSGNVGIGTTSPTIKFQVTNGSIGNLNNSQTVPTPDNNSVPVQLISNNYSNGSGETNFWNTAATLTGGIRLMQVTGSGTYNDMAWFQKNTALFYTGNTERMRIDSSGNVLVGTTTSGGVGYSFTGATSAPNFVINKSYAAGSDNITFRYNGTNIGTISTTTTNTAYNTSSDYRLKQNIAPMVGALAKVAQLKPVTYKWKSDGSDGEGFIAHELAEVCPHAVTGEKDAVDADGKPIYQGIDVSFLVATLTAAIQEQQALITQQAAAIEALTTRITALEGTPA